MKVPAFLTASLSLASALTLGPKPQHQHRGNFLIARMATGHEEGKISAESPAGGDLGTVEDKPMEVARLTSITDILESKDGIRFFSRDELNGYVKSVPKWDTWVRSPELERLLNIQDFGDLGLTLRGQEQGKILMVDGGTAWKGGSKEAPGDFATAVFHYKENIQEQSKDELVQLLVEKFLKETRKGIPRLSQAKMNSDKITVSRLLSPKESMQRYLFAFASKKEESNRDEDSDSEIIKDSDTEDETDSDNEAKMLKRRNLLEASRGSVTDQSQTTAQYRAQFHSYLTAYQSLQAEASSIVIPFLQYMLASNSSSSEWLYPAARSIYVDLTGASVEIKGPFDHSWTAIDSILDFEFGGNATAAMQTLVTKRTHTQAESAQVAYYASMQNLITIYTDTYEKCVTALNQRNVTRNMATLALYMQSTHDKKIMSADFEDTAQDDPTERFFTPPGEGSEQ